MPDPHHVPHGRDVLETILTTSGAELSATGMLARRQEAAGSLHRLDPIRRTLTVDAAHRHWEKTLPTSGLTPDQVTAVVASPRSGDLYAALTRGHEAGHDMPTLLTDLTRRVTLNDDDADVAAVLHEHVTTWLDARHADPRTAPDPPRTAGLVDVDDPAAPAVAEIEDLIRQRISALTTLALAERPAWMDTHRDEPDPGPDHEAWLAGITEHAARLDHVDPMTRPVALNLRHPATPVPADDGRSITR